MGVCEACGGAMRRLLSAPAFQFKGTGWYVTDYSKKSAAATNKKSESATSGGENNKSKATDSKAAKNDT